MKTYKPTPAVGNRIALIQVTEVDDSILVE